MSNHPIRMPGLSSAVSMIACLFPITPFSSSTTIASSTEESSPSSSSAFVLSSTFFSVSLTTSTSLSSTGSLETSLASPSHSFDLTSSISSTASTSMATSSAETTDISVSASFSSSSSVSSSEISSSSSSASLTSSSSSLPSSTLSETSPISSFSLSQSLSTSSSNSASSSTITSPTPSPVPSSASFTASSSTFFSSSSSTTPSLSSARHTSTSSSKTSSLILISHPSSLSSNNTSSTSSLVATVNSSSFLQATPKPSPTTRVSTVDPTASGTNGTFSSSATNIASNGASNSSASNSTDNGSESLNAETSAMRKHQRIKIAAGTAGGIVGAALLVLLVLLLLRCRSRRRKKLSFIQPLRRSSGGTWIGTPLNDAESMGSGSNEHLWGRNLQGTGDSMRYGDKDILPSDPPLPTGQNDWAFFQQSSSIPSRPSQLPQPLIPPQPSTTTYRQRFDISPPNSSSPFISSWGQGPSQPQGIQIGTLVVPEIVINSPSEIDDGAFNGGRANDPVFDSHVVPISPMAVVTPTNTTFNDGGTPTPRQATFNNPFRRASVQTSYSQGSDSSRYSVPSPSTYSSLYQQLNTPPVPPLPSNDRAGPRWSPGPTAVMPSQLDSRTSVASAGVSHLSSRFSVGSSMESVRRAW
ncbi:unnamed protein product [Somion occarium]|uniref:Uncharacterized protein n=1 Tax=Somion occarium TaxID=3059160 RepID=A0ABP1DPC7_9APHY